jgi:hypothetical protein
MVVADASQIYRSIAEDAERPQFSGLASTLTSAKTSIVTIAQILDNGIEKDAELLKKLKNTADL